MKSEWDFICVPGMSHVWSGITDNIVLWEIKCLIMLKYILFLSYKAHTKIINLIMRTDENETMPGLFFQNLVMKKF